MAIFGILDPFWNRKHPSWPHFVLNLRRQIQKNKKFSHNEKFKFANYNNQSEMIIFFIFEQSGVFLNRAAAGISRNLERIQKHRISEQP